MTAWHELAAQARHPVKTLYSHRSFRPKQADAFSLSFVRERVGLRSGEISLRSLPPADTPHLGAIGVLWPVPAGLKSVHLITNRTGMSPSLVCNESSDRK